MPILSYLVHARSGCSLGLRRTLAAWPECEVLPADSGELLILVTATDSEAEEKSLQGRLRELEDLAFLALVFAHDDGPAEALSSRRAHRDE